MEDLSFRRFETNPIYDNIDYTHEQLLSRDKVILTFTPRFSFNNIHMNISGTNIILEINDDNLNVVNSSILNDIKMGDLIKRYIDIVKDVAFRCA